MTCFTKENLKKALEQTPYECPFTSSSIKKGETAMLNFSGVHSEILARDLGVTVKNPDPEVAKLLIFKEKPDTLKINATVIEFVDRLRHQANIGEQILLTDVPPYLISKLENELRNAGFHPRYLWDGGDQYDGYELV